MLRYLLATHRCSLPVLATCIFNAIFLAVLLRVSQRARAPNTGACHRCRFGNDSERRDQQ
jgi:hypothetical protein